jgi:stage V sporulation protein G
MPSRKNPDDTYRDIVHPINSQFRASLEEAVIEAYEQELAAEAARQAELDMQADLVEETPAISL